MTSEVERLLHNALAPVEPHVLVLRDGGRDVAGELPPPLVRRRLADEPEPDAHQVLAVSDPRPDVALAGAGEPPAALGVHASQAA